VPHPIPVQIRHSKHPATAGWFIALVQISSFPKGQVAGLVIDPIERASENE
jgi:hypothetical protein